MVRLKSVIITACMLLGLLRMQGAEAADTLTARYVFAELKAPALELLSRSTRLDMLAYADENKHYDAPNEMKGTANLEQLTTDFAKVKMSMVSEVQILTLPYKKGSIAAVVYTVSSDGADSELLIYDSELQQLKAEKFFSPPVIKDFIAPEYKGDKKVAELLTELIPFISTRYELHPDTRTLTATLTVQDIVSEEAYNKALPYLAGEGGTLPGVLTYRWNGKKFVLAKP